MEVDLRSGQRREFVVEMISTIAFFFDCGRGSFLRAQEGAKESYFHVVWAGDDACLSYIYALKCVTVRSVAGSGAGSHSE